MQLTSSDFDKAKELAKSWQQEIHHRRQTQEKKFHQMMQIMLKEPRNKLFLIELLDQSFRTSTPSRVADQLEYLFKKYPNRDLFSTFERLLITLFRRIGIYLPSISIPMFIDYLRHDVKALIIEGEEHLLTQHLQQRRLEGTRVNINIIGESVLGEAAAAERIATYRKILQHPDIDYISIKISTIFSQISPLAHEWSVHKIASKLEVIYDEALQNTFTDAQGNTKAKFVNLDMEEYNDLALTVDAFTQTLSLPRFTNLYAGIVLQAYLPDSFANMKRLVAWAQKRVQEGGSPIKIRLVKGANQEMELTHASLRSWPNVTYDSKEQTDANFKVMMDYLLTAEVASCVHTGIASHNLFDHALAYLLATQRGVQKSYSIEMLEGMSEAAYRVLKDTGMETILYAPTATKEHFTNAIAYLVRRFDESTAEQNFLRHSFGLQVDTKAWQQLVQSFDDSVAMIEKISHESKRQQDRNVMPQKSKEDLFTYKFKNCSDTDFSLEANRAWAQKIVAKWKNIGAHGGYDAYAVVASQALKDGEKVIVKDKSQYHDDVTVGTFTKAAAKDLQHAVKVAKSDLDGWRDRDIYDRAQILMQVASKVEEKRGDLIGMAAAEVGKVFSESDVEVSEAIDFLHFYPYSVMQFDAIKGLSMKPEGVGVVISPWNFPIAIACGGIAAALAAGNTVIFKPSSDAVLCGYMLCQCFWEAGVSQNTLQFAPSDGSVAGEHLVGDWGVDFVIFTGSEGTAHEILKRRPDILLCAETGGKDATIVTAMADRDQAIKNVVASAFNNSGQKCSATSLLVLERELFEDEDFKKTLVDAAASLEVGSAWDLQNRVAALIQPAKGKLQHALEHLEEHETWALAPIYADHDNPYMLKPSIRWGTQKGDFCHAKELFGPVLSVMCAENLQEAIDLVNATGYGLTSGLESLDEREQEIWKEKIIAGNLYINRVTTGAIVRRQPFGGMRNSSVGAGIKAGGVNYVTQFMYMQYEAPVNEAVAIHPYYERIKSMQIDADALKPHHEKALGMVDHFAYWMKAEFFKEHDESQIRGESNLFTYRPVASLLLRLEAEDLLEEMLCSIAAAKMAKIRLHLSISPQQTANLECIQNNAKLILDRHDRMVIEDENQLIASIRGVQRVRFLRPEYVTEAMYESVASSSIHIAAQPFIACGRLEILHYFMEQTISNAYHRYGNLGLRGLKVKEE